MAEKSVASSKSGSKQSYIVQEKTGFEKLSAEIKDSVFQVLYLILKEEDGSFIGFMIEMGLDYLQMGAFCFEDKINGIWKASDFLEFVFKLFSFFQIQTYFSEAFTFTSYLISFYICIAAITLVVINILYVSIAFSKKRVTAIWPVTVLRAVTGLFFTVFFLPITELLISMLECDFDENGDYVQSKYPEIKCWQGSHIIHATIAILVIIIFVILGFIVALAYFEIRMLTEDITARQHSRGDVIFISNKILLQLAFSFLSEDQQWILVLIITIGACVLWRGFNMDEPYYRKDATLFFKVITTYYLWTALLLFFSKALEDTSFDGGLIVWAVGIPFIGVVIYTSSKSKSQSLAKGTSRFSTSTDLMDHLRYLLQLIDTYDSDKNARILLSGYVEKHRDTCDEEDCPLKVKRKKKTSHGSDTTEISLGLTLVVDRMYQAGLKKFKSSAKLRIAYAVFLLERMKKMKKAEQELAKAQELKPGFEDQFVIFRLTKMISDGLEGVDVVGLIAWDNYKNLYQEFVRESANLHKEFWSELREDTPNLKKLSYLGSRVNAAMSQASDYWNKVQKVRPDDPIILKTYGRFLIDIQNDVVEGYDLIEKAKKMVKKIIYHQFAKRNSFDAGLDNLPYVEVVGSGQDMGTIKQANLLFTVLAGVNREEIVEKKINIFMPDLFSQYHDTFLKRFNNREEDYDIGYLDNDNSLFIRSRSGYVIPVTLRVSRIKTEETTNQIVFGAWFRTETAKRTYVHFLCSKDGAIMDMSASAVTILNLSPANVKKNKMSIDKIVPNALIDKGYREGGKEISFKLNEASTIFFIATITPIVLKDDKNMDFITQYAIQNPGHPLTVTDKSYGYIVKLDKLEKAGEGAHNGTLELSKLSDKRKKRDTVQSSFDRENSAKSDPSRPSKMDNLEEPTKKEEDGQIIWGFNTDYAELEISELFQNDGAKLDIDKLVKQEDEVERERIDYGQGIGLKKFIQEYLYDIHDESETPINLDDDDEEGSLFNKKDDDELDGMINKKRKDKLSSLKRLVKDALEANQRNSAVTPIRWLTFGWLLMIFVISILQYVIISSLFGEYGNRIHVVRSFVEKLTEIDLINSYMTDFMVFDAFPNLETDYSDANLDTRKQNVRECVTRIVDLTSELEGDQYYSFLKSYINDPVTITIYGEGINDAFTLNETEALFFIASRAYNLLSLYEGSFDTSNKEVLSVISNFYNVILPALRQTANEMQVKLKEDLGSFEYQFILLFILNGLIALLISIWGMILLLVIDQQKEDILFLFLEIPPSNIDSISRKRDKFTDFFDTAIRQLQNNPEDNHNQDENTESDGSLEEKNHANVQGSVFDDSLKNGTFKSRDPNSLDEEEDALKDRKKLIKKFKSKKFTQARNGVIKVILLIIVSLAYSISISVTVVVAKSKVSHYCEQFFTTNILSDSILSAINANRLMRLDGDFVIEGQTASQTGVESLWELNTLGSNLGDFFLYIISKNNDLETEITTLFFGNACDILDSGNSTLQANCEQSLSNALKSGLFNLKEQVFKILMKEYTVFKSTSTTTSADQLQLFYLNDDFKEYTFNILQQFNSNEEDFLNSILDSAVSLQEILLSIYLVLTTLMLLILWMPYLSRLNAEVWRTTRMINMIPLDVVNNIPSIKRFLKNIVRRSTA